MSTGPRHNGDDPLIGAVVAERYELRALIGVGGMGSVYRARQTALGRDIALKLLLPELSASARHKERFRREARAASVLRHPNAVVVHDFGEWEGRLFIAMELLDGRTLGTLYTDEAPLSSARIVSILAPVCDVLDVAHAAGLVHRDIKPDNIMITRATEREPETVKLVDFGLVKLLETEGPTDPAITPLGMVSGTPAYMSPEQLLGRKMDGRSDLYSLGVVLYQLICGRLPYEGDSPAELAVEHLYAEPLRPPALAPDDRSEALATVTLEALAKDPAARPGTGAELAALLRGVLGSGRRTDGPARAGPGGKARLFDRAARAAAAGVRRPTPPTETSPDVVRHVSAAPVIVVEPVGPFVESLTALLRANGYQVIVERTLPDAVARLWDGAALALAVDVRAAPDETLAALQQAWPPVADRGVPLLVIGPDDSFHAMQRALDLGAADYVATSVLARRLLKALARRSRRPR